MSESPKETAQPQPKPVEQAAPEAGATQPRNVPEVQPEVRLNDADAAVAYANFCRVAGTPEELVLDFALNTRPSGELPAELNVGHRIIMNFYTAKRLLGVLHMAVQRHEATFGPVETDIRRRVVPPQSKDRS